MSVAHKVWCSPARERELDAPVTVTARQLGAAMASELPGLFTYPPEGCPAEGIAGGLNAVFEAHKVLLRSQGRIT